MTEEVRDLIRRDRFRAHEILFEHRHEYPFAPFHSDLVADFWSPSWVYIDLGFRECGKTTLVEEGIIIAALEGGFRNCLIVGAKQELAAELLTNIKTEIDNNDALRLLYGEQHGAIWTNTKITLMNGACIQAHGVGQQMRGTQHLNRRPDLVVINDFEDDEEVLSPDGRRKAMRWLLRTMLPACDRARRKIRVYDSVRDADSVPMMLIKRQKWPHRMIPISYLDETGQERSSWPGHPTLTEKWIADERAMYANLGEMDIFEREYMCSAESQADRTFTSEMIKVEPVEHTFQAKYAMIDPARSVKATSAFTGWAVWSWERHRLIVWEAGAKHLMPDEIVELAFRLNRDHQPVEVGIEEDGLNEWLMQPIRQRVAQTGEAIPYKPVKAPHGKLDFIRGLQPFFAANGVTLVRDLPELRDQLLGFPTGRIDAPNALAYALTLKPGRLIYEGFNPNVHIGPIEALDAGRSPVTLAVNATRELVAGVLVQSVGGRIGVLADWIVEGEAAECGESLVRSASIFAGRGLTAIAGPRHFDQWQNVGLVQALRECGVQARPGGNLEAGRSVLRRAFERNIAGEPEFTVSPDAHWTLRALAGGYSKSLHNGRVSDEADNNRYRVLIEGLESLCGLFQWGAGEDTRNYAHDRQGNKYLSALPAPKPREELKVYG
jgi:hypothetical protein